MNSKNDRGTMISLGLVDESSYDCEEILKRRKLNKNGKEWRSQVNNKNKRQKE